MKFVKKLYDRILMLHNQGQSQYFSPTEVMLALNQAQIDVYNMHYKVFEKTQEITDVLRAFKDSKDTNINSNKTFDLPSEYFNLANVGALVTEGENTKEYEVEMLTDGEWITAKNSKLLPPETEYPKGRVIKGAIEIVPSDINKIRIYYLKKPKDCLFKYKEEANQIVYEDEGSIDTGFPETAHKHLIARTLVYLGISTESQTDIQSEQILDAKS